MLLQRENQRFSLVNGTTLFAASWPMSARPPKGMPERPHQSSTIDTSSRPKSGSFGRISPTRPSRSRRSPPDVLATGGHMEHRAVDPIEMLARRPRCSRSTPVKSGSSGVPSRFESTVRLNAIDGRVELRLPALPDRAARASRARG